MIRLILLIVAITLDSFVFCLEKGATSKHIPIKNALLHSIIFASISAVMAIIGYYLGFIIEGFNLFKFHIITASIIFMCIGIYMLWFALRKRNFEERLDESFNLQVSIRQAIINSIDTFVLGISLNILSYSLTILIPVVFFITLIFVCAAFYIGYYNGAAYQKQIGLFSALVYFVIAIVMLIMFSLY